jgi:hypothetical protein
MRHLLSLVYSQSKQRFPINSRSFMRIMPYLLLILAMGPQIATSIAETLSHHVPIILLILGQHQQPLI